MHTVAAARDFEVMEALDHQRKLFSFAVRHDTMSAALERIKQGGAANDHRP